MTIKCIKCRQEKPEEEFGFFRGRRNQTCEDCRKKNNEWYANDKDGRASKHREYYHKNKEKIAEYRSNHRRKKIYNLSKEEFDKMLLDQDNSCAICGVKFGIIYPCVDHDHDTGNVRALLCRRCNLDLQVVENHEFVLKAQDYLKSMK